MGKGRDSLSKRLSRMEAARLWFDRLLLRGLHYRLIFAAIVVLSVALTGGLLVWILDPEFGDVGESVWWAFLRLTDPGYLGDDEGLVGRTVSTIVTVLGYLLFLGLLIAILTQWMNEVIARIESGVRPLRLRNHILILGCTSRTPMITHELLRTRGRLARFLEARDTRELRIVVLDDTVDRQLITDFKERLGELWDDRQVLLRSGSPLKLEHLERVSFDEAATIILPGQEFGSRATGVADADTLKTLQSIARHTRADDGARPLAVAALYNEDRDVIARRAYGGEAEIVPVDRVICRLIAQSVRQPGMWTVLSELLSLHAGNALYLARARLDASKAFEELAPAYARAVPIGTICASTGRTVLNPVPGTEVAAEDYVVFIAPSFADCTAPDWAAPDAAALPAGQAVKEPSARQRHRRILILGWSRKIPTLLREFSADDVSIDVVGLTPLKDRESALIHCRDLPADRFRQLEANFLDPIALAQLEPWNYDNIILMARARMGDEAHADAATITAYLTLQELLEGRSTQPDIFVELREQENAFLFDGEQDDVLISPLIISYMLSQIALRRELGGIFAELSRVGGPQLELCPLAAGGYSEPVGFAELSGAARRRGDIALGILTRGGGLELNPDRSTRWEIGEGDQLVILTTDREPD